MKNIEAFIDLAKQYINSGTFVKLTLSKPVYKSQNLQNVYYKELDIKGEKNLSATLRFTTNDKTKNYEISKGLDEIRSQLSDQFRNATLITQESIYQLLSSKKGKVTITKFRSKTSVEENAPHDREKTKRTPLNANYLHHLGITTIDGRLIPKMADKYRQINKYLEIMDHLIASNNLSEIVNIIDMGSGKGYLTFALYDFLINKGIDARVTGIELRNELVDFCNDKAKRCGFEHLNFVTQRIEEFETPSIDILIALHACDTATDDAMAKGILANAKLIVCAPCCHKQVRQQVKGKKQNNPLLKYGIFQERHFEMVTDTIRALLLEKNGYNSKIFEFVSNEHTRKNIMLIGAKTDLKGNKDNKDSMTKIEALKAEYNIDFQYLEQLV